MRRAGLWRRRLGLGRGLRARNGRRSPSSSGSAQRGGYGVPPTDQRFEGRTAAVTGAGGFIGKAVCRRLAAEGADVRGLDVNPAVAEQVTAAGAAFVEVDVADRGALRAALDQADLVVHTAAQVREWGSMDDFVRVNVAGTAHVLEASAEEARTGSCT